MSNPIISLIVAHGENFEIGAKNDLMWHLPNDFRWFVKHTKGKPIIMGRKTFESFPRPLPNRTHVVITRQKNYKAPEDVLVVNSLEKAIEISKNDPQPYIIGGGEIYKQALNVADKIELTRVHANFEGDTFFPEIDLKVWKEISKEHIKKDDKHACDFSFITYTKQQN